MGQTRAGEEKRSSGREPAGIEGRHRAARLAEENQTTARAQTVEALFERRGADRVVDDVDAVQFGYDTSNRRTSLTLPNGILVEYGYDAASRVTSITYKQNGTTLLGDLTYEYDKAGNRTKTGGSWARTGMPEPLNTTSYDANNRQLTFGDKTLAYDDNGNLQSITDSNGTTLYSWNARNQLVAINGPTVNASFVYDGVGRREAKTINGGLTEFLYDGLNPVQETSGAAILANILPGLGIDEFLTRTDVVGGVTNNNLAGAPGSTVSVADNTGAVQTNYTYEPYGRTTVNGPSGGSYQFTGRENDGTGLYYYRARYYHAGLQRFISEDPLEFFSGDVNLYAYAQNNPIMLTDPLGLWTPQGHRNLTGGAMGLVGGFSPWDIAGANRANNSVDLNPDVFSPYSPKHYMPASNRGEAEARIKQKLCEAIARNSWGDRQGAMKALGEGLHTVQDKWSHANASPPGTMSQHYCARKGTCPNPDSQQDNPSGYANAMKETMEYIQKFKQGNKDCCP